DERPPVREQLTAFDRVLERPKDAELRNSVSHHERHLRDDCKFPRLGQRWRPSSARRRWHAWRRLRGCPCRTRIFGRWRRRSPPTPISSSRSFAPSCRPATLCSGLTRAGMIDLSELTARTAGDLLDARSLSSQELVEATLARIEETEPLVHAYVTVLADSARAAARQ